MKNTLWIGLITIIIETITCITRFGFNMQATRDLDFLSKITFGLRIHHGYIGVVLILVIMLVKLNPMIAKWFFRIGASLILSDLIHHFIILWIVTGSHQFDIMYPK